MKYAAGVNLQIADYSQESDFLKMCARSKSFNVAKLANDAIIVTSEDMLCLREGESIGSKVIDCYFQILEELSKVVGSKCRILTVQCAFGSTFDPATHGLSLEANYLKQLWKLYSFMWKGVNFLSVDKVFIPWYINFEGTTQWSMVVVNKVQQRFEYYNSCLQDPKNEFYYATIVFFQKFVEWQTKQEGSQTGIKSTIGWCWLVPDPKLEEVRNLLASEIPGQKKRCDSGVLLCMYVKYLSEARPWDFTYKDVPKLRLMMVRDIVGFSNLWSGSECYQPRAGVDTSDDVD
jgi:Ulp1 family protease